MQKKYVKSKLIRQQVKQEHFLIRKIPRKKTKHLLWLYYSEVYDFCSIYSFIINPIVYLYMLRSIKQNQSTTSPALYLLYMSM